MFDHHSKTVRVASFLSDECWLLAALVLTPACTVAETDTATSQSALSGTIDVTAAEDCAMAYVACVRASGTNCRAEAVTCVASGTSSATTSGATDGGKASGDERGGKGHCADDGSIDASGVAACLDELDVCALSDAAASSCVSDAVTCVTGTVPTSTAETEDSAADAGDSLIH